MIRMITIAAVFGLLVGLNSCMDPEPGEISIIATKNGRPQTCTILVYNSNGVQINLLAANMKGLVYIKKLVPGIYSLKFRDNKNKMYPAEHTVSVVAGQTFVLRVKLNEGPVTDTP